MKLIGVVAFVGATLCVLTCVAKPFGVGNFVKKQVPKYLALGAAMIGADALADAISPNKVTHEIRHIASSQPGLEPLAAVPAATLPLTDKSFFAPQELELEQRPRVSFPTAMQKLQEWHLRNNGASSPQNFGPSRVESQSFEEGTKAVVESNSPMYWVGGLTVSGVMFIAAIVLYFMFKKKHTQVKAPTITFTPCPAGKSTAGCKQIGRASCRERV